MNLVLLFDSDFVESDCVVRLEGRRMLHMMTVHKVQKGNRIKVGRLNGKIGHGIVNDISNRYIELNVSLNSNPPPPLPVTLVLALPRPKTLKKVLQCVTAMGVKRIFLIRTWRVEKSYFDSPFISDKNLLDQFILGLEQGCDTIVPSCEIKKVFKPFAEDELPSISAKTLCLAPHPGAETPCPHKVNSPVTLAIGPEGGFIQYEIDTLEKCGFKPVNIGPRPLRVEDAAAVTLGKLF